MRSTLLVLCTLSLAGLASAADLRNGLYKGRPVVFENIDGTAVLPGVMGIEGFAELADGDLEDGVSDERLGPDGGEEVVLCDELARAFDEVAKQGERLGAEGYGATVSPQALVGQVEGKGIKVYPLPVRHAAQINAD